MIVNFEFLSDEPIENVITCLNYKIDKAVYLGYIEKIDIHKKVITGFLKENCQVSDIEFIPVSHDDLQSVINTIRKAVNNELAHKNKIYFDITGGESLILTAFGALVNELHVPTHQFDIKRNKLIEFEEGVWHCISSEVPARKTELNIDRYIELYGGVVNHEMQKKIKSNHSAEFEEDVAKIWNVARRYKTVWTAFSDFLRRFMAPDENLHVVRNTETLIKNLSQTGTRLTRLSKLNDIIDALSAAGVLKNVSHNMEKYEFTVKNEDIKACIWDGGSILELHVYQTERQKSNDCKVGVHLDWDGVIHKRAGDDVLNEIDVLSVTGNIPTFISCKFGSMSSQQTLHALYELQTVADRFGGKYAKKVLVTPGGISEIYKKRADEMNIEIRG